MVLRLLCFFCLIRLCQAGRAGAFGAHEWHHRYPLLSFYVYLYIEHCTH
jgi:hypothetical protein